MTVTFDSSRLPRRFRTGVSLHSHTLHSRETLGILYQLAGRSAMISVAVRVIERALSRALEAKADLTRGWWTPPLSPSQAVDVEREQIEAAGLSAIVSISDHDNIDGPMSLRVLDRWRALPISVEWTVPFAGTFFHVGLHNIPRETARETMYRLAAFTSDPSGYTASLGDLLEATARDSESLVVLNHPYWDEAGIGGAAHEAALRNFILGYGQFIHAVEFNGLRPWHENQRVLRLAQSIDRPVVAGGDRHGVEANTVLNLTSAGSFGDFAEEIRSGVSNVLITERYKESHALRIIQNFEAMSGEIDDHAHGWSHWSERVFYQTDAGETKSFKEIFKGRIPVTLNAPLKLVRLVSLVGLGRAIKMLGPRQRDLAAE